VGRGFRARPQVGLEQVGGYVAAALEMLPLVPRKSSSGFLQGFSARAILAEK
jgi:hypothetical protein